MNSPRILEAWRDLLPEGVEVSAGPLLDDAPPITPREQESAGAMDTSRMLEFKTGRAYAKLALTKLGVYNADLPIGANRAPIWPLGMTGSITHTMGPAGGHVAAAVARANVFRKVGIDVEVNRPLHPQSWTQFLTGGELQHVRDIPMGSRARLALTIWCVKEAVAKAICGPVDPMDIEVTHHQTRSEAKEIWRTEVSKGRSSTFLLARTMFLSDFVLAAVIAQQVKV